MNCPTWPVDMLVLICIKAEIYANNRSRNACLSAIFGSLRDCRFIRHVSLALGFCYMRVWYAYIRCSCLVKYVDLHLITAKEKSVVGFISIENGKNGRCFLKFMDPFFSENRGRIIFCSWVCYRRPRVRIW